jgi:probable rRNA maturation factor
VTDDADSPTVSVSDRQETAVDAGALTELARETLRGERAGPVELSVSLVTRDEMTDLHRRYLDEEGATDVLSFSMDEDGLLGDVVICPDVAASQSDDLAAELRLLLVHGILHLLGYDHEEEEERLAMWERQEGYSGVRI